MVARADRVGPGSYWVYQHLGNLSRRAGQGRAVAAVAGRSLSVQEGESAGDGAGEVDISAQVDAFAERVDQQPTTYRWSFTRDIDDVRLVVVDSRAARCSSRRTAPCSTPTSLAWLDEQMQGGFRHLLVGTSSCSCSRPACTTSRPGTRRSSRAPWGNRGARFGEWMRQVVDLEHWGAFQHGFGRRRHGPVGGVRRARAAPDTVTFLSGDVHHSYVSEVRRVHERSGPRSRIVQAVCSPIRNPLPRAMRFATAFLSYGLAGPMGAVAAKSAHVPDPPFTWGLVNGPWFDNNLAVLEDKGPEGLGMVWYTGVVEGGDHEHPGWTRWPRQCSRPGRPSTATGSRGRCPGA